MKGPFPSQDDISDDLKQTDVKPGRMALWGAGCTPNRKRQRLKKKHFPANMFQIVATEKISKNSEGAGLGWLKLLHQHWCYPNWSWQGHQLVPHQTPVSPSPRHHPAHHTPVPHSEGCCHQHRGHGGGSLSLSRMMQHQCCDLLDPSTSARRDEASVGRRLTPQLWKEPNTSPLVLGIERAALLRAPPQSLAAGVSNGTRFSAYLLTQLCKKKRIAHWKSPGAIPGVGIRVLSTASGPCSTV